MFERIRDYFGSKSAPATKLSAEGLTEDLKLATAVVLVAAASADKNFAPEESIAILNSIERQLGIDRKKAQELLNSAKSSGKAAALDTFLPAITSHFSGDQRERILAIAWSILAADGVITPDEGAFAADLRRSLGLSLEEALRARKLAEHAGSDGFKELLEASPVVQEAAHSFHGTKK